MTAPTTGRRAKIEVVAFAPEHADALAGFIRKVWDPSADAASVLRGRAQLAAANPSVVDGAIPTVLLMRNGEVVGHLTSFPERVSFAGRVVHIAWLVGFQVLPEFRNGPVGVMVAQEMAKLAPNSMCSMVLDAPLRIFTALGWRHLGTVPNQLRVLDGAAFAQRLDPAKVGGGGRAARLLSAARRAGVATLGGRLGAWGASAWAATAPQHRALEVTVVDAADWEAAADADALWTEVAPQISASLVRDGARVRWRFGASRGRFVLLEGRLNGRLRGWVVVKRPRAEGDARLGGLRVAPVVDLLFAPDEPDVGAALIAAAARWARRTRAAEALLASTTHEPTQALFQRAGFVRIPGNLQLVAHPNALPAPAPGLGEWWHARGDGDADQSF